MYKIQYEHFIFRNEEYQLLKDVTHEIEKLQNILFHEKSDESKTKTVLGLIGVSRILEIRWWLEMFYLNTIEQVFLFVEQLDQLP